MKLYPKARPVRIKLNVGGEEHSSLDTLQANFNVDEVLQLYASGGLQNWLRQINRLDLLSTLSEIEVIPVMPQRYVRCIQIFFDELKHTNSIDDILNEMYEISSNNFNRLLIAFTRLKSEYYLLTVDGAEKLWQKAKQRNDKESLYGLNQYLIAQLDADFKKIHQYMLSDGKNSPE
ncbi:MAG: hypothetical protein HDR47_05625, partial [Bacteroides sp.]|nr:hypothetical protein [Bacteroides sp.]